MGEISVRGLSDQPPDGFPFVFALFVPEPVNRAIGEFQNCPLRDLAGGPGADTALRCR